MSASLSTVVSAFITTFLRSVALNALSCLTMYVARWPARCGMSSLGDEPAWHAMHAVALDLPADASPPANAAAGRPIDNARTPMARRVLFEGIASLLK